MNSMASTSQLSVAVALPVAAGSVEPSHSTVISAGQVISGAVASRTVTWKLQLPLLPLASVAVQVTVCVPATSVAVRSASTL